ncbi:MAG TPA: ATP-binding protein [Marmoricola sp.]|nr:ATP-binding protein [Marmoricola sp.]
MNIVRRLAAETRMVVEPAELADVLSAYLARLSPDIRSAVIGEAPAIALSQYQAYQVFLVLREAIRNAVAHGQPQEITVETRIVGTDFTGTVTDDGTGFTVEEGGDGTGLASMRERASILGATLTVVSDPGRTEVKLTVPLARKETR